MSFHDEQEYTNITAEELPEGTFELCTFTRCDFSNGRLSDRNFVECTFIECNFTNSNISHSTFQQSVIENSKLMGLQFESCRSMLFSLEIHHSKLDHCTFTNMALKGFRLEDSEANDLDFSNTDLRDSSFNGSTLTHCLFESCQLQKADFRNTQNLIMNPEQNQLQGAMFSEDGLKGLLMKYGIKVSK